MAIEKDFFRMEAMVQRRLLLLTTLDNTVTSPVVIGSPASLP